MRIRVFIDYWNFQLTLNEKIALNQGVERETIRAKIDWRGVGLVLAKTACPVLGCDPATLSYEGCYVYTSFNPATDEGRKYRGWATTWLDMQPGVNVEIRERKPKALPRCTTCHQEITHCPHKGCAQPITATTEKGIDTLLVTDLIRFAVNDSYDSAVLASLDADLIPGVQFVQSTGRKVIQAGFPPKGVDLATECWGSFDLMAIEIQILRP